MDDRDQRVATVMADYWAGFAWSGDPNGGQRPVWPEYRAMPGQLLMFGNDGPAAAPVPFVERLDLIEALYARIR